MKVGIIGSGDVGRILGNGFAAKGHDVVVGTRDPKGAKGKEVQAKLVKAKLGTFAEAAKHGEVLVLCVHGTAAEQAVELAGPQNLAGKLVLDTTNPLEFGPKGAHKPASVKSSILEAVQAKAPKARFVKAWNCTPGGQMVDPKFKEGPGDQLICGDDPKAKEQAVGILKAFGWNAVDVGDASMGPYVEGAAIAVINYGARTNDWGWGIKLLGRKA
jgi:predicted dinucleotide-binding enzyme